MEGSINFKPGTIPRLHVPQHCTRTCFMLCLGLMILAQCFINILIYSNQEQVTWTSGNGSLGRRASSGNFSVDSGHRRSILNSLSSLKPEPPKPPCPKYPPRLKGHLRLAFEAPTFEELEEQHPELMAGGSWHPANCSSHGRVAIVIPFRDREKHLRIFLAHMHPFLQRQLVHYTIFVVEQDYASLFNRGMLANIGFHEAELVSGPYDCYIIHDVDLLPENDRNLYNCPEQPRHMSVAVDTMGYRLPYDKLVGGVLAMSKKHFQLINGFSNEYFGWGGEDDDMYERMNYNGLNITRYPKVIARYRMLLHRKRAPSKERYDMLEDGLSRYDRDGINSLVYEKKSIEKKKLYTLISVGIDRDLVNSRHFSLVNNGMSPYVKSRLKARERHSSLLRNNSSQPSRSRPPMVREHIPPIRNYSLHRNQNWRYTPGHYSLGNNDMSPYLKSRLKVRNQHSPRLERSTVKYLPRYRRTTTPVPSL